MLCWYEVYRHQCTPRSKDRALLLDHAVPSNLDHRAFVRTLASHWFLSNLAGRPHRGASYAWLSLSVTDHCKGQHQHYNFLYEFYSAHVVFVLRREGVTTAI